MNRKTATEAFRRALRATLFAALAAAPSASHGALRMWEPSDYQAQDAMILHFDGIRNAGLSEPHSAAATSWINLADSERPAVFDFGSDESRWDSDGFYFGGLTYARVPSTALDTAVTIEIVSDIDTNVLISAYSGNYRQWPHIIGFEATGDRFDLFYHTTASPKGLCLKRGSTTFKLTDWDGRYAVGIIDETKQVLVQNAAPNAATWGNTGKTGAIGTETLLVGSANVAKDNGINKRYLTGKIKALRLYNRVLTDPEVAANRAIDEARFFGAPPVTNAVVATSLAGAEGADASGAYAVDGDGYTFRAAPFATVGGTTYACTGCTVETSADGGATWGAPVACDGTYAVDVASTDCKRITWQWAAASGTICGETSGYVQRGLALHYDGIRNAGAAAAHDASATAWTDLSGNGRHGTLSGNADGSSAWEDDGFRFNANAVFNTTAAFSLGTSFTAETLLDVAQSDATRNLQVFTMNTVAEPQPCYLYYHNGGKAFRLRTQAGTGIAWGSEPTVGGFTGGKATYVSAFRDGETDAAAARAAIVAGATVYPTSWKTGSANAPCTAEIWRFGAARNSFTTGDHPMKGAIKSVRLYSRLLSEDECAWNRAIDDYRFFGTGAPVSNAVIVATSIAGLEGREESGLYFADGWTFAAPDGTVALHGLGWRCAGYQLQTWDTENSCWIAQGVSTSRSYTSPAAGSASVRLVWLWKPAQGARTAADFAAQGVSEYVRGGLELHFDGIRNAGAAAAHDASATAWTDLSGNGRDGTLSGNADGSSAWEDDGFRFNANAVFNTTAAFSLGTSFTAETLLDVAQSDATRNLQIFTMNTVAEPQPCYLYYQSAGKAFRLRTQAGTGIAWASEPTVGGFSGGKATYVSAFRDGETDAAAARAAIAAGSAVYPAAWKTGSANAPCTAEIWRFGAARNAFTTGDHPMKGAIKSVRLYSRLLSEDECAWNRAIDSARYFGALAATNVVIAAGDYSGLDEDTAYQVFGSATFAAVTAADGSSANFVKVQTLQPDGTWGDSVRLDADSYTYTAGTSPAIVKIDFRKTNAFVMVVR